MHMFKAHGCKAQVRLFATAETCPICLVHFHDRPRLLYHLKYSSPGCLPKLLHHADPVTEQEADLLDAADAEQRREERRKGVGLRKAWLPAVRLHGPRIQVQLPAFEDPGPCVPCGGFSPPLNFNFCKGRYPDQQGSTAAASQDPAPEQNKVQAIARAIMKKIQAGGRYLPPSHGQYKLWTLYTDRDKRKDSPSREPQPRCRLGCNALSH